MDLLNPFFTKGLPARISKSKKCIKATVVSCDITGGITLGTKQTDNAHFQPLFAP